MARYEHGIIDKKWQERWAERCADATPVDRTRPKYYVLDMFPYPSGSGLHVGHPKGYVATDVVARAKRMMGFNVLRVMGWDSFGLPAERQAVRENKHPREITERNIKTFKDQLQALGLCYDWERELATSDERYYRWTQWIFARLHAAGLAYQADVPVNWCPALGTVLANEEVKDGVYVETGDPVERRLMKQWMLRITAYGDKLAEGLEALDWPEGVKEMQRHWIGRSEGAEVHFAVDGLGDDRITIFTTRPDTLFGCTYVVLAPEHPLVDEITTEEARESVREYRARCGRMSERDRIAQAADAEKTGVPTGAFAVNPVSGEKIPIWIADYVLATYGTGAVFACPAHDERDHAFATTFGLPIREVVSGGDVAVEAYGGDGPHVNSEFLDGLDIETAKAEIIGWLAAHDAGEGKIEFRLRDWLFSRQRYWGEPFPVIHTEAGEAKVLSDEDLPVLLPGLDAYTPTEDGRPPLARAEDWVRTTDPETGQPATRETNTMPQWAGSCWYYLRFLSPNRTDVPWDAEEERYWMPVDLYVGGAEHAVLHLLYARFWHKVLHDQGLVTTPEPFQRLVNQGMVHAPSYQDERGRYYYAEDAEERDGAWFAKETGIPLNVRMEKMSKSRYNVVNPNDMCREFGADALRLYELFMAPLEDGGEWETSGVAGTRRFLDRVWRLVVDPETGERNARLVETGPKDPDLDRALHGAIVRVTDAAESLRFNTSIAALMTYVNEATRADQIVVADVELFLRILAPFAPHIAEELWERLGNDTSILEEAWPTWDESALVQDEVTIVVQVNGKVRGRVEVAAGTDREALADAAKASVAQWLDGKTIRKEIVIPDKLVNIVVG